jgi:hypothetical protein
MLFWLTLGTASTNNCGTIRAIVNRRARIILYTKRKIRKGGSWSPFKTRENFSTSQRSNPLWETLGGTPLASWTKNLSTGSSDSSSGEAARVTKPEEKAKQENSVLQSDYLYSLDHPIFSMNRPFPDA